MKAVVADTAARQVRLEDRPVPEAGPGEALIRVRHAGICGTDLEIVNGYMPGSGVLGHEFVGKVEACADASWIGRRVVGGINVACGSCAACAHGEGRHCEQRTVLGISGRDGAMATHLTLPVANLLEVPAELGDEHAVFAEPLAAALEILDQVHVHPRDRVLVLGDGRLAQLVVQVLALVGCEVTVSGRHRAKLDLARASGARVHLSDELPAGRYALVVEATGSPDGPAEALARCQPRGTVVLKSTTAAAAGFPVVPAVIDEIRVVGSRCGDLAPALRLLASGRVAVSPLVSGVYPLSRAKEAFAFASGRDVLKVLLDASS